MSSRFVNIDTLASLTLPSFSIDGDDGARALSESSGDIVHRRAGQIISVRSWGQIKTLRLVFKNLNEVEIANLRAYWRIRVFYFYEDTFGPVHTVYWRGDFSPEAVSPSKFNITADLEELP